MWYRFIIDSTLTFPAIRTTYSRLPLLRKTLTYLILCCCISLPASAHRQIDSLIGVAEEYFRTGDYVSNLKLRNQILAVAEQTKDCSLITNATLKIASAYYYLQQSDACMEWMILGRQQAYKCQNDSLRWRSSRQVGILYFERQKHDSALIYLHEANNLLAHSNKDMSERSAVNAQLGDVYYFGIRKKDLAKPYYDKAYEYAMLSKDSSRIAYALSKLGNFSVHENKCKDGITYFKQALALYKGMQLAEGIMYGLESLGFAYSKCGDAQECFHVMQQLRGMRDSIFKAETATKLAEYRTLYETEKKEKANLVLTKDIAVKRLQIAEQIETKRTIITIAITGFIILCAIFLLLYTNYRQRKKREMDERITLAQKLRFKAVLEAEEKERVRIARELHDGLGQVLSAAKMNMVAIDSHSEEDDKLMDNAKKLVDDAVKEVRSISHNLMPSGLTEYGLTRVLEQLVKKVNDSRQLHVELVISESDERLNTSLEIAIYRMIQEVLNNMIKHSKANSIEVNLDYTGDKILLYMRDNGIGFNTKNIEHSTGIGWKNIFSRVYMMNGEINIESSPGNGTEVNIELKK